MGRVMPRVRVVSFALFALVAGSCAASAQEGAPRPLSPLMQGAVEKSRAAIIDCRARRLRKEIANYKASADCSNPKIFAAWQEAGYPHMDLIMEWLNSREAASEKVDQDTMSPKEFEEDMDSLTIRLTAEEKRRRSGMIISPDGDMQLHLPATGQVVGVAGPPGEEKLEAKKAAAARERAAAAVPAAGGPGVSIASLEQFVSLDSDKARGTPVAVASGEGSSGLYAQLGSQRSEAEARSVFHYLQGQYAAVLSGRDAVIRRVDQGNLGSYYRVEVGPLSSGQADELCGAIKAGGGQCVPRFE
jgi:hypothetical protein